MDIRQALTELNAELAQMERKLELYACGGVVLRLLGIVSRDTADIDVIIDAFDPTLVDAKNQVAKKLRISADWLNNHAYPLTNRLSPDWMNRCVQIFTASHLTV